MSALPPESFLPAAAVPSPPPMPAPVPPRGMAAGAQEAALAQRWGGIHQAAGVVAALAGVPDQRLDGAALAFPGAIARAGGQRLAVARHGMDDLAVILETGIRALLSVHATGANPAHPAGALWMEFCAARDALLALAPPEPRRLG